MRSRLLFQPPATICSPACASAQPQARAGGSPPNPPAPPAARTALPPPPAGAETTPPRQYDDPERDHRCASADAGNVDGGDNDDNAADRNCCHRDGRTE